MSTAILGLRGSGQFDADFRPKNYREVYSLIEPNGTAPLSALLSMTGSESTDDPEFRNFKDELPDRVLTTSATATNSATTIAVNNTADLPFVVAGTLLANTATGEIMRVSGVSGTDITVARGIGGGAAAVASAAEIVIAGFADQEGGTSPEPVSFDPIVGSNFTQIFKTSVSITGTLNATNLRTGDKEQEDLTKALKMHMSDIERAFFFGKKAEMNASTASPTRYTGGLLQSITGITDASTNSVAGRLTEKEFDRALVEDVFAFGNPEKICFAGAGAIANLMEIGKNRWQPTSVDNAYGVSFTRYTTFAGDLLVYLHPMFRQIPSMKNEMVILDMPHLKYRHLDGRDTSLQRDIQTADFDGKKHQYMTECGLELSHSKVHHRIKGWTSVS